MLSDTLEDWNPESILKFLHRLPETLKHKPQNQNLHHRKSHSFSFMLLKFRGDKSTQQRVVKISAGQLTLNSESGAAARTTSIIMNLTRVDAVILKPRGAQLEVCGRVNEHGFIVSSVGYLLVIFVPAHFQGACAGGLAFKAESLTLLDKGSGRQFQDKLRGLCKVKKR